MIVVIDTSVVLNLCFLHQEGLLTGLFDGLLAPSAVRDEFERLARTDKRFQGLSFPSFISVEDPITIPARLREAENLDAGEIAALALALERHIRDVLIDEAAARRVAEELGLRVSGLLAVIVRAKKRNLLRTVGPLLDRLENEAHFWIGPELRQQVLSAAGETS